MYLPLSKAVVSDRVIIQHYLPNGFTIMNDMIVRRDIDAALVARATIVDGFIKFEPYDDATLYVEFEKILVKRFPRFDPEKVYWQLFYWEHNNFWILYDEAGYADPEEAMSVASKCNLHKIFLCSIREEDRGKKIVQTLTSQVIRGSYKKTLEPDFGPVKIPLRMYSRV